MMKRLETHLCGCVDIPPLRGGAGYFIHLSLLKIKKRCGILYVIWQRLDFWRASLKPCWAPALINLLPTALLFACFVPVTGYFSALWCLHKHVCSKGTLRNERQDNKAADPRASFHSPVPQYGNRNAARLHPHSAVYTHQPLHAHFYGLNFQPGAYSNANWQYKTD